ncbi:hypothetical protein F3Y22_tig00110602pilonHSYRG00255 [Hibiscus syriacus]|uniref:RNase H type-1 domain-containing protein n=1 Tax=Hibiscus syriacus TaxID=106335 RepID=A0A6A3A3D6_HIBSY|nr:hypothetical protein F3Y22_tig00110602pilonHSYRG00255 [Hibiscus syriacus]
MRMTMRLVWECFATAEVCGSIFDFARAIGICSVLEAELWGALEGLRNSWSIGTGRIILEVDNGEVYRILNRSNLKEVSPTTIRHISGLLERNWVVSFSQVRRVANRIADHVAKMVQHDDFEGRRF